MRTWRPQDWNGIAASPCDRNGASLLSASGQTKPNAINTVVHAGSNGACQEWRLGWGRTRLQCRGPGFDPCVGKIPWRRKPLTTAVFLPGESHGQRRPVGYSPLGCEESDTTERLTHTHSPRLNLLSVYLLLFHGTTLFSIAYYLFSPDNSLFSPVLGGQDLCFRC